MSADKQAEIESREKDIFAAIEAKNLNELKRQLDALAQLGVKTLSTLDFSGAMPLIAAAKNGFVPALRLLVDWCEIDETDLNGRTALMHCASSGDLEGVEFLAERSDTNARNNEGFAAVHCAAKAGHLEIVRFFAGRGPLHKTRSVRDTVLCVAAKNGHLECVRFLAQIGDPEEENGHGYTALAGAIEGDHPGVAAFLSTISPSLGLPFAPLSRSRLAWHAISRQAPSCLRMFLPDIDWIEEDKAGKNLWEFGLMFSKFGFFIASSAENEGRAQVCLDILQASVPLEIGRAAVARHGAKAFPLLFARLEAEVFAQTVAVAASAQEPSSESSPPNAILSRMRL